MAVKGKGLMRTFFLWAKGATQVDEPALRNEIFFRTESATTEASASDFSEEASIERSGEGVASQVTTHPICILDLGFEPQILICNFPI